MKFNTSTVLLLFIFFVNQVSAQKTFSLRGNVKDTGTGKPLMGVAISLDTKKTGILTDSLGNYYFRIPQDEYVVKISFVGYKPFRKFIQFQDSINKCNSLLLENNTQSEGFVLSLGYNTQKRWHI